MAYRKLSAEESNAINWFASFKTEAEVATKNPSAVSNPDEYARRTAKELWRNEAVIPMIVQEYRLVAREGKLSEPLWPELPRMGANFLNAVA